MTRYHMPGARLRDDGADAKLNDVLYGALCDYPEQWYDPPVYVERRLRLGAASYLLHIGNDQYDITPEQMDDLRRAVRQTPNPDAATATALALEILNRD